MSQLQPRASIKPTKYFSRDLENETRELGVKVWRLLGWRGLLSGIIAPFSDAKVVAREQCKGSHSYAEGPDE